MKTSALRKKVKKSREEKLQEKLNVLNKRTRFEKAGNIIGRGENKITRKNPGTTRYDDVNKKIVDKTNKKLKKLKKRLDKKEDRIEKRLERTKKRTKKREEKKFNQKATGSKRKNIIKDKRGDIKLKIKGRKDGTIKKIVKRKDGKRTVTKYDKETQKPRTQTIYDIQKIRKERRKKRRKNLKENRSRKTNKTDFGQ